MLDTLQKMSGITHKVVRDSKTITQDIEKLWMRTDGKLSYQYTAKEFPVITYNDMAFISPQNSIVFRAGDSPVWNRNQTMLPMSWQLFANTITQPGKKYTLQTIPTLSTAMEFDVRRNQPDFEKMLNKRMAQARYAKTACEKYQDAYGYSDFEIMQLDPDIYSDEVMQVVNDLILQEHNQRDQEAGFDADDVEEMDDVADAKDVMHHIMENKEMAAILVDTQLQAAENVRKIYAKGELSKDDLCPNGIPNHQYDEDIIKAYTEHRAAIEKDTVHFSTRGGSLCSVDGSVVYIEKSKDSEGLDALNNYITRKGDTKVYADNSLTEDDYKSLGSYEISNDFYRFLVSLDSWKDIAGGRFDQEMYNQVTRK